MGASEPRIKYFTRRRHQALFITSISSRILVMKGFTNPLANSDSKDENYRSVLFPY